MKYLIASMILTFMPSCEKSSDSSIYGDNIKSYEVKFECIHWLYSFTNSLRIDSKRALDSLAFSLLKQYLEAENYDTVYQSFIDRFPDAEADTFAYILTSEYGLDSARINYLFNCNHPKVDFEKYTLLSNFKFSTGCDLEAEIKVYRNDEKKEITSLMHIDAYGYCKANYPVRKWVLVDKISADYTVVFLSEFEQHGWDN